MWARAAAAVGVGVTVGTGLVWIPEWVGVRQVGLESRDGSDLKSAPTTPRLKPCHDRTGPLLSAIGNTPLLEIPSLSAATGCRILGKAEWMNPGGSIKDRCSMPGPSLTHTHTPSHRICILTTTHDAPLICPSSGPWGDLRFVSLPATSPHFTRDHPDRLSISSRQLNAAGS
jgi:hypothetical protein